MSLSASAERGGSRGRRILIIKLGALGDVVLSIPQIARILEAHAGDEVTLLTAPDYVELVAALPRLQVIAFHRKGASAMLRLLYWLLGRQFDSVYDLQGSWRSRIMTLLTQAQLRAGPVPAFAYTHTPMTDTHDCHAFDRFNEVLTVAGVDAAAPAYRLPLSEQAVARVDSWLQQQGIANRQRVLMHVGASHTWSSKRWPEQYFLQLAQAFDDRGLQVIWLGGETESAINRRLAGKTGINATSVFTLAELVALGRCACFAVSNDSGPMHVLSAANIPVYALFGPTDWQCSHALGQAERVLVNPVPCSPCHLPVCPPQRKHVCLDDITPVMIMTRLEADGLLQSNLL